MKFVTFNLRCDSPSDGINAFSLRKGMILDKIHEEAPDLVGFQEVRPHMQAFLERELTGYNLFGRQRGGSFSESNPIAYKKDAFQLLGLETQWLSPTPFVEGSRYQHQSDCPRIFTHMQLQPVGGGSPVHVINTHLDHVDAEARLLGAKQLIEYMRAQLEARPWPLVLTGDFNAFPDEVSIQAFKQDTELCLTEQTDGLTGTWHGYGTVEQPRIDYIFTRDFIQEAPTEMWTDCLEGVYLSDHYPIAAHIKPVR